MENPKKIVFVMGPFRSGTSMICRVLVGLGLDSGPEEELFPPTEWNPDGYIQRPDVTLFNTYLINKNNGTLNVPKSPLEISDVVSELDFEKIDLRWIYERDNVLIKDPRFCFTLKAWLKNAPITGYKFQIIRVVRDIKANLKSALSHYDVREYCGPTIETATKMLTSYDDAARWHCNELDIDHFVIKYEDILSDSSKVVAQLADFVGCKNKTQILSAINSLNSGKSLHN
jgi:hypothetical protein